MIKLKYGGQYRGKLSESFMLKLSKRHRAIIIGTILGDGCLECRNKNVRLRLEHGIKQEKYLLWKFKELKSIITGRPMQVHALHSKSRSYYDSLRIYTFSDKSLNIFWKLFYRNNKKVIPQNISKLLNDPLSLAVWFMDDGYKRNDCNAFRINTDSFKESEQNVLCQILKNNFGIDSSIHRKGKYWNIYIPQSSSKKFVEIVKPYIIPSMKYKIALAP